MKSIKYILAISFAAIAAVFAAEACGPYSMTNPAYLKIFRSCSPELEQQWEAGCRFQDYEKDENCALWQNITSPSIPLKDIETLVYDTNLYGLNHLADSTYANNKFAQWLLEPQNKEDLDYLLIAKEIEEIRTYMNDPWYYPYDGDEEHTRLNELMKACEAYNGSRHADRYALQTVRLCFAKADFPKCIKLWEDKVSHMPQNIVTDMIASYVGGAYSRKGDRQKAIDLFTRSQDIGSLISLKAWDYEEEQSKYSDSRVKELEYIFNRFPNSPLLSIKLQKHIRNREAFISDFDDWKARGFTNPVNFKTKWEGDSLVADDEHDFYDELKLFAKKAAASSTTKQQGMWNYALAYLDYLDGKKTSANSYLAKAERSEASPTIKESIHAFRFLIDASSVKNIAAYKSQLLKELKWLDECMARDAALNYTDNWQYKNKLNWSVDYWQDVARKILLGEICPRLEKSGDAPLALQLANYASNRILQVQPLYEVWRVTSDEAGVPEFHTAIIPFDEYRKTPDQQNRFDYCNQFFQQINASSADDAARYATLIAEPRNETDRFLNARGYTDTDYIYDIVGTLYLREMNYVKAAEWLSKVSSDYQGQTNLAKEGYFRLDPFRYQSDKKAFIPDSTDYKLRFAREMTRLEKEIASETDANRKANAKIRYATGLRNSFGSCWYLTQYGFDMYFQPGQTFSDSKTFYSSDREGFTGNPFAKKAYKKVDRLMAEALSEFTNPEQAAQAQLEMMNYATLMAQYPNSQAASTIRGRCDKYSDYGLQQR